MANKNMKFLQFDEAISEIVKDFRFEREQYDLFAEVYTSLMGGKALVGEAKCPPFGLKYGGIWYQPRLLGKRKFYSLQEFPDLLVEAFISKNP